jgi:hypothetical protein
MPPEPFPPRRHSPTPRRPASPGAAFARATTRAGRQPPGTPWLRTPTSQLRASGAPGDGSSQGGYPPGPLRGPAGVKTPLRCDSTVGKGSTTADWSSLPATGDSSGGAGCTVARTNPVPGTPIFVDAPGASSSPAGHERHFATSPVPRSSSGRPPRTAPGTRALPGPARPRCGADRSRARLHALRDSAGFEAARSVGRHRYR